jgi:hypothetical protein
VEDSTLAYERKPLTRKSHRPKEPEVLRLSRFQVVDVEAAGAAGRHKHKPFTRNLRRRKAASPATASGLRGEPDVPRLSRFEVVDVEDPVLRVAVAVEVLNRGPLEAVPGKTKCPNHPGEK